MKTLRALALLALALPAFGEGVTGINLPFFPAPPKLDASMDWGYLQRRAYPDWPTILMPNGVAHRVSSLCSDGTYLRDIYAKKAFVCHDQSEGNCLKGEHVELKTLIRHTVKHCLLPTSTLIMLNNSGGDNHPVYIAGCDLEEERPAEHKLTHDVKVYSSPHGELLFKKSYTIAPCPR